MRIVIIGLGYGGLRLALDLEYGIRKQRLQWELVLVDQHPFHQLVTELHQVVAGSVAYDYATIAYGKLLSNRRVTFQQAKVEGFDLAGKRVLTDHGPIAYDRLVIALGGEVDFFESANYWIPGLREHALVIQPIQQAHRTYTQIQERLYAFIKQRSPSDQFSIAVGGGGSTGVELGGHLADEIGEILSSKGLPKETVVLHVIEAGSRLIAGFHPKFSDYVTRVLRKKGVQIHLKDPIVKVSAREIALASGKVLPCSVLVWCGGVKGHPLLAQSGLKTDAKGRLLVNGYLQCQRASGLAGASAGQASGFASDWPGHGGIGSVASRPPYPDRPGGIGASDHFVGEVVGAHGPPDTKKADPDVYAMGDCTFFLHPETGVPSPPMARLAIEQGRWLARYLLGKERFPYLPAFRGAVISLGKDRAVAVVGNLRLYGRLASWLKNLISLKYLFSIGRIGLILHQVRVGILGKI